MFDYYFQCFLIFSGAMFWQYVLLKIGFKIIDKFLLKENDHESNLE